MRTDVWEVIVIGGGPSGMMAAATAGARGKRVLLLEKNRTLGKKLLITGGGRCNVTNNKPMVREMLGNYKSGGKFLFSTFTQHGVSESIAWFKDRGVTFKEENEGRLFPVTDSAKTICDALVEELKKTNVRIRKNSAVNSIAFSKKEKTFTITLTSGEEFKTNSCIVSTGGTSRPETGATGDGYPWLKKLGHQIIPNNLALVPLTLHDTWTKKLSGLTLPKVKITLLADGKKQQTQAGKLLFTHVGVTGPTILNMSKVVGELLAHSAVSLQIDLLPQYDAGASKSYLQELFLKESNKKLKNVLATILPSALVAGLLQTINVGGETFCHSVTKSDRTKLLQILKALPLSVKGLLGADKAVISAGGVVLEEINFKTMQSRIIPGLFIVGDLLNIDRPSGGYSLQLCWSTGFVAGTHC